ncbi:translation initiation factor [Candidatus Woesearchaeota archaeon]|nr:translation initiation factor [Candidatus Woesearchaeota archaeon]
MPEVCTQCGLPKELCVCETIAKERQAIRVSTIKKKFGKVYTVVEGIDEKEINTKNIIKNLKSSLACGGTIKDGNIELQGDHKQKVRKILVELGFAAESIQVE